MIQVKDSEKATIRLDQLTYYKHCWGMGLIIGLSRNLALIHNGVSAPASTPSKEQTPSQGFSVPRRFYRELLVT